MSKFYKKLLLKAKEFADEYYPAENQTNKVLNECAEDTFTYGGLFAEKYFKKKLKKKLQKQFLDMERDISRRRYSWMFYCNDNSQIPEPSKENKQVSIEVINDKGIRVVYNYEHKQWFSESDRLGIYDKVIDVMAWTEVPKIDYLGV